MAKYKIKIFAIIKNYNIFRKIIQYLIVKKISRICCFYIKNNKMLY